LTPTQIANATTSTDGDLTYVDISDNINNADAWIGAIDHGIGSSGLFESLFESLQLYLATCSDLSRLPARAPNSGMS
jgi:hypothetical protein